VLLVAAGVAVIAFRRTPRRPAAAVTAAAAYPVPGSSSALKIEVLNGTGREGLARAATRQLRQSGFDVVHYGDTPGPVSVSQVIGRRVSADAARPVAKAIGVDSLLARPDSARRVDVSVWLGKDYRPPRELHP
jgi:hypothetical protein